MEAGRFHPPVRWLGEQCTHRFQPVWRIILGRGFNADVPAAVAKNRVQPQKEVVAVSVGDKVNHTSFGNGTVLAVEGAGDKTVAKVKFDVGEKRLLLRYAPLTRLDA
jgi:DNA helicase-2/ATP-dependent DNA helicase PcrA